MNLVKARLKSVILDGIEIVERNKLNKEYLIDLDTKTKVQWFNTEVSYGRTIEAVADAIDGGYLPFELLELI